MRAAVPPGLAALIALAAGCAPARTERPAPTHRPRGTRPATAPRPAAAARRSAPETPQRRPRAYPPGIDPARTSTDPTWGYSKLNPIKLGGPAGTSGPVSQRIYLRRLRGPDFRPFKFRRLGNVGFGPDRHIVDLYELVDSTGKKYRLYLDMYHLNVDPRDLKAPKGLYVYTPQGKPRRPAPSFAEVERKFGTPMRKAEAEYALALALWRELGGQAQLLRKRSRYAAYVTASQKYVRALVKFAEARPAGGRERESAGRKVVAAVETWLARQKEKEYEAPPEGVRMWFWLHLGRGYAAAGDVEKACTEGFERALGIDPEQFEKKKARGWAWRVSLTARIFMVMTLSEAAEKTGDEQYWLRTLKALTPEFDDNPVSAGRTLGVRARILRARALEALGEHPRAVAEFEKARKETATLRARGEEDPQSAYAADLEWRIDSALAKIALQLIAAGEKPDLPDSALTEAGKTCYRRKDYRQAIRVWKVIIERNSKLSFARRCKLRGEPTARFFTGIAYYRLGEFRKAQDAYEGAIVEFWVKMPAAFRGKAGNHPLIERLKREILAPSAGNGRIAAEAEKRGNMLDFDPKRLRKWVEWERRLKIKEKKEPGAPEFL